jgi:hypothetical protein
MSTNVIQGIDAVLSFKKSTFLPFVCSSNVDIEITTDTTSVKTIGDGIWDKQKAVKNSYTITLSGVLKFDNANFSGWDVITNQIGWVDLEFLLSFTDDAGNIKSFSGFLVVQKTTLNAAVGQVVKDDFSFVGNGGLKYFDGLIPCPSAITAIVCTNPTDASGNLVFTYTYTGAPYQVKYRLDGSGPYAYALVTGTFTINGVSVGTHSIEVIPICSNNYEGTSDQITFSATHSLTCTLAITSITSSVSGNNVTWTVNFNAAPGTATIRYSIDGGAYVYPSISLANPTIFVTALPVGAHTISIIPTCANGVDGTGNTGSATVSGGSLISTVNYNFTAIPGGSPLFNIYVNGLVTVTKSATASGSINVNTGDVVKALVQVNFAGRDMSLKVEDSTLVTTLYNHSQITGAGTVTDSYIWTANGDTFLITATISP